MRIYFTLQDYASERRRRAAVTIGNFDGVHRGHGVLLRRTVERARHIGADAVAVTFDPHPRQVLSGHAPQPLMTLHQKALAIASYGFDALLVVPFDKAFAELSADDFVQQWLIDGLDISAIIVGYDFRFGRRGTGTAELLEQVGKKSDFAVERIDAKMDDGAEISSTLVRETLANGDIRRANRLLTFPYAVEGPVVQGAARGREIGFPTANVATAIDTLLPIGIYGGVVRSEFGIHVGAISLGYNPTFVNESDRKKVLEVYILDFDEDLYGKPISVEFISYVRAEQKFAGVDALVKQISHDVGTIRATAEEEQWLSSSVVLRDMNQLLSNNNGLAKAGSA